MKKGANFFVANTPFQIYVIGLITKSYFQDSEWDNIIFATCPLKKTAGTYPIRHGMMVAKDLLRMKRIVKEKLEGNVQFFIPHLCNLISNYFYNVAREKNKPLNVFYEGLAQFYYPDVRIKNKSLLERKLISSIFGLGYEARTEFFPKELTEISVFYTPIPELCIDCKQKIIFEFPRKLVVENNNVLFLSSNKMDERVISEALSLLKQIYRTDSVLYFKPHYELPNETIKLVTQHLQKDGFNFVLLDKYRNIEQYYEELSFSRVLSQEFSSALVNIKLVYQDQVVVKVMKKPKGVGEKIYLYYGFGKDLEKMSF